MSNVSLMKNDGGALIVPPGSVICLLSTALDPKNEEAPTNCALMTTFRGLSTFLLRNTAHEAFEALEYGRKKPAFKNKPVWIKLEVNSDFTYLQSGSAPAFEQMSFKNDQGEDDRRIRVHIRLPSGGFMHVDVSDTENNWNALKKDAERHV